MFNVRVDTDFINSSAYACHLLPVWGFQPLLDEVQEVSCKASSIHRKRSDVVERRSDPNLYMVSMPPGRWATGPSGSQPEGRYPQVVFAE